MRRLQRTSASLRESCGIYCMEYVTFPWHVTSKYKCLVNDEHCFTLYVYYKCLVNDEQHFTLYVYYKWLVNDEHHFTVYFPLSLAQQSSKPLSQANNPNSNESLSGFVTSLSTLAAGGLLPMVCDTSLPPVDASIHFWFMDFRFDLADVLWDGVFVEHREDKCSHVLSNISANNRPLI